MINTKKESLMYLEAKYNCEDELLLLKTELQIKLLTDLLYEAKERKKVEDMVIDTRQLKLEGIDE